MSSIDHIPNIIRLKRKIPRAIRKIRNLWVKSSDTLTTADRKPLSELADRMNNIDCKTALFSALSDILWLDDHSVEARSALGDIFKLCGVLYDVMS